MRPSPDQAMLFGDRPRHIRDAVALLADAGVEERGAIFTRREVVDFLLDLVGYTVDAPLKDYRLLEPSFGGGEFLLAAIDRLVSSYRSAAGGLNDVVEGLSGAVRAVEVHRESFETFRARLQSHLITVGLTPTQSLALCEEWLICDDFLLTDLPGSFTHVVGNPPYVRQELIHEALIAEYRRLYSTIYDRADLYVPFIERSLRALAANGRLGFICADRWMKNRYGGPLRRLVSETYHLTIYVDMVGTQAFESEVTAYPAIFVIERNQGTTTAIARKPIVEPAELVRLASNLQNGKSNGVVKRVEGVVCGAEPWLLDQVEAISILRRLESTLPTIEEAGCTVGIGVASGADKVYIRPCVELDIEDDRKVPIAHTWEVKDGTIEWTGQCIVNPFLESGELVDLNEYPRLARYLQANEALIRKRHVAKQRPANWYRTIDRIYPGLTQRPKLLIPDIKGGATVVLDEGKYYPHHNFYYVVSDSWDLRALRTVLGSSLAEFFVAMYCVRMRGGFLRFQAQYVRRIRLPHWASVPKPLRKKLMQASAKSREEVDDLVFGLYELTEDERRVILRVDHEAESKS